MFNAISFSVICLLFPYRSPPALWFWHGLSKVNDMRVYNAVRCERVKVGSGEVKMANEPINLEWQPTSFRPEGKAESTAGLHTGGGNECRPWWLECKRRDDLCNSVTTASTLLHRAVISEVLQAEFLLSCLSSKLLFWLAWTVLWSESPQENGTKYKSYTYYTVYKMPSIFYFFLTAPYAWKGSVGVCLLWNLGPRGGQWQRSNVGVFILC